MLYRASRAVLKNLQFIDLDIVSLLSLSSNGEIDISI